MGKPFIGAIRWDAWHGDLDVPGRQMQMTLQPEKYHYRLPYYTKFKQDGTLSISHVTQDEIDEEIRYAIEAKLDYFAFCMYERGTPLALARDKYLDSAIKDKPKWCAILGVSAFPRDEDVEWLYNEFTKPFYFCVAGNRPLVFLFDCNAKQAEMVKKINSRCAEGNLPSPYYAAMGFDGVKLSEAARAVGADALSAYTTAGENGESYADNCKRERDRWDAFRNTGFPVLPWVTAGWDPRPRMDHIVPWAKYEDNSWAHVGDPEEIAGQLKRAVKYAGEYKCDANAVLIYAWNEFDEGGWLLPTLFELEREKEPVRINAIARALAE